MQIERRAKTGVMRLTAARYAIEFRPRTPLGLMTVPGTRLRLLFFPGGACNRVDMRDETRALGPVMAQGRGDACHVTVPTRSSAWRRRETVFVCREESIEVFHRIEGRGDLDQAIYLRGYWRGQELGFAGDHDEVYCTAPNFQERSFYHPAESFYISFGNNLTANVGGQALASPCPCVGLHDRRDRAYLSVGLVARPGEMTWDDFAWNPEAAIPPTPFPPDGLLGGGFAARYAGKLSVRGAWESPRLVLTFAPSREKVLPAYLAHAYAGGWLPRPPKRQRPVWWREPIYCTWHDQVALADMASARAGRPYSVKADQFCTQRLTDRWVRRLEARGCRPGIVILDATWQKHLNSGEPDPAKWPDMRGWIEGCHHRGIRVFVWTAAWSKDGLPPEECTTCRGEPVACDITNPKYERRFRDMIRRWFSDAPDCLNADGVKMDGLLSLPTGPGLKNHAGLWGLELQRRFLQVLHEESHRWRPDACVSTFVAHPYLAGFSDMVRIADMYTSRLTAHETMLRRGEVYRQTMPDNVVDTDGQFGHYALDDYVSELAEQAKVGSPTIYCAEWVARHRFFLPMSVTRMTEADYREIARVFAAHRRRVRREERP